MSGDFGTHFHPSLVSAEHMMVGAYTDVGMMLFAREMDEEVKIARFGGRNYIPFYSVHSVELY